MIYVSSPLQGTWIVASLLGLALLLSLRRQEDKRIFPVSVTQELKGFAILVIIFGHLGYALSTDPRFLWPLSNLAGVGVNIFLFVSGYGLTSSNLKRKLSVKQFYKRRLEKLYTPFWLILIFYFLLDFFLLHRTYPADYVIKSFAGIFQTADVTNDINSPLWYFTLIAFYYLIYPLVFIKKRPWLSAMIIFAVTYTLLHHSFIGSIDTARFYKVYTVAFPLGMVASWIHYNRYKLRKSAKKSFLRINKLINIKPVVHHYRYGSWFRNTLYFTAILGLLSIVVFSRTYSAPWDSLQKEQAINVLTMLALVAFFMLKRVDIKLLYIFGVYSYEIYLLHWPLLSRYDVFFKHIPAWLAVTLYLIIFIILGWILNNLPTLIDKYIKKLPKK